MKFKKLASLLIAGAMVFTMAMPAFALDSLNGGGNGNEGGNEEQGEEQKASDLSRSLKFKGTTSVPTINVDMVTDAAIILNPYGLTVTVGGEEKTDPFLTETIIITNKSDCKLAVSGSFTPSLGSDDVKLVANATAADTGKDNALADKNVALAVVMGQVTKEDSKIDFASSVTGADYRAKIKSATSAAKFASDWLTSGKQGYYALTTKDTAVNFGDTNDNNSGKVPYVMSAGNENPTYMAVRIFGLCEKYVKEAWTADDTVSVAMAVTLAPNSN